MLSELLVYGEANFSFAKFWYMVAGPTATARTNPQPEETGILKEMVGTGELKGQVQSITGEYIGCEDDNTKREDVGEEERRDEGDNGRRCDAQEKDGNERVQWIRVRIRRIIRRGRIRKWIRILFN